ncbi:5'-nucleotidase, cytosolic III-like [Geranomyces michiganensis]|nr:5'-nucleotidase, cytosolic III-like [Geranomyces michiganensis]
MAMATAERTHSLTGNPVEAMMDFIDNPKNSLYVKDPTRVREKLTSILADGKDHLHIISDFDMTISRYWVNGERNVGSHRVLALSSRVPEEFTAASKAIFEKYYPIEISQTISHSEKVQAMVDWWSEQHELILDLKLTKDALSSMAQETHVVLRDGVQQCMQLSEELGLPLLVFSAGLGDVIEAVLRKQELLRSNVDIISNKLHFGPDKIADRFEGKIIHTFNKDEANFPTEKLGGRENVVCSRNLRKISSGTHKI